MKLAARTLLLPLVALVLSAAPAVADEWVHTLAPYAWGPGYDGHMTIRGQDAEADASGTDILDNVEFAALLRYEGHEDEGHWGVMADAIYLGLGYGLENVAGNADVDIWMGELDGQYRFNEHFQVYFGVRGYQMDGNIELDAGPEFDRSESWLDGLVGFRTTMSIGDHWGWMLRGDLASFGSDLTWNAETAFAWSGDHVGVALGWRVMGVDYEKGSGTDEMALDCTLSGPEVGLLFRF